jgi:GAF domain-containing protein
MSPQEGRGGHSGAGESSRQTIRRLVAALADSGFSPSELRRLLSDNPVQALIGPALADPNRLKAVQQTGLLERSEPDLDSAAALTASALGTPYAAVSLFGRDHSLMAGRYPDDTATDRTVPLEASLCKFPVATAQPFIVDDAQRNPLVSDNPMVRSGRVMSYAGIPLMDGDHNVVGALASWDDKPRRWTAGQIQVLTNLSVVVAAKIFGRRG